MAHRSTLNTLEDFLQKTRRRLSDENPDYSEQDEADVDPDSDMYSETEDPDAASQFLAEHDKEAEKPEHSEYAPGEDEDAHQAEALASSPKAEVKAVAPTKRKAAGVPVQATAKAEPSEDELQPSREDLAEMRKYTRPWEQRARDKDKLEAQPHVNPIKHQQGHIVEARNTSHADRQKAYEQFTNSPEFQNADPISQMEMESKFHEDWHKKNPEHLINALTAHSEAHKKGDAAKALYHQAKDDKIRHIASGGAQPGAFSVEEGMQHAGGSREDEDSAPSGISQDKGAAFASGNQEFLNAYMNNYDKRAKKFDRVEDMDNYDPETRTDVESVLGDHPAFKDPAHKRKVNSFVEKYHPLIGKAARRVLAKLGLTEKANSGEIDPGLLHEAGVHALFQAVNDYDHDHPSKAKFVTHLNRKMHGLMQTALKTQDEIPEELRAGAKKFDKKRRSDMAAPAKTLSPEEIESIKGSLTAPSKIREEKMSGVKKPSASPLVSAAPVAPKKSAQEIATAHSPEVQDRLKRVVAAKGPIIRRQGALQPKPVAAQPKKWNINNVTEDEGGEE